MIQHVARGMFGAIIVGPARPIWPKADREYVLIQSELFKNPDDVPAMFDRKFEHIVFNGSVFKYHPFVTGGKALEAKPGERVRIYFITPARTSSRPSIRSARAGTRSMKAGIPLTG